MLVEFSSVVDAVRCAVEIQRAIIDRTVCANCRRASIVSLPVFGSGSPTILLDLIATALLSNCGQAALPAGVTLVRSAYGSRGISARLCPPSVSPPSAGFRRDI